MNQMFLPMRKNLIQSRHSSAFFAAIASLIFVGAVSDARAQFTFASDNAGNYSGSWTDGSDGGSGFGGWGFTTGTNTGSFIGNPSSDGISTNGMGSTAFGMFSTANNGQYANRSRGFDVGMGIGDTFSFDWGINWDTGTGAKGFDLKSGGTTIFNVNNGTTAAITTTGSGTADSSFGTNNMRVTLTRTSTGYTFTMTRRSDGTTFSTNFSSTASIDNFNFYIGSQQTDAGQRNMYFDNLAITNSGVFASGGTVTNANRFTGSGALSVGNNTTLVLSGNGNNNYTGATSITNGSTLVFAGSGTTDLVSAITGGNTSALVVSNSGGQVNLSNNNTAFDGSITVHSGNLEAWTTNSLGSGTGTTTVLSGGTLRLWNTNGVTYAAEALTLNGTGVGGGGALRNITNNNVWQGNITIGSGTRINSDSGTLTVSGTVTGGTNNMFFGGSGNISLSNTISGSQTGGNGAIFKDGSGVLTLSANNSSLSGLIRLREGTISITNGNSLGSGSLELGNGANVATLLVNSNTTIANRVEIADSISAGVINVASGQTATVTGILSQTNGTANSTKFGKDGAGILIFNNAGGTYNGQLQIGNGTIVVGATGALGANNSTSARGIDLGLNVGDTSQGNNVSLRASNGVTVGQSIFVAANTDGATRTIGLSGSGTNTFSNEIFLGGTLTVDAGALSTDQVTISGAINNTGGLTKTGAGVLLLSGNNGYTGATTISAGTLRLGADNRIASQSAISIASGATLDMNNFSDTLGTLTGSGNISLGSGTLTTSVGADTTFSGSITGSGALTKTGTEQFNLSGSNNYAGLTTISTGSIEAQNAHALGSTNGATTVTSGANLKLWGTGSGISYAAENLTINGFGPAYSIPAEGDSGALRSVGGGNNVWNGNISLGSNSRINSDSSGGAGSLTIAGNIAGGSNVLYVGSRTSQLANMTISGILSGAGASADGITTSLHKSSANTLTISGAQNYTGATRITAGTLFYNGTNTGTAVRVESGGTLAGTGSVGATTVLSGGTMNPGSSPGTQNFTSLTWEGGGNYNWQIYDAAGAAGVGYDTFTTGAFNITANSTNRFNINLWSLSGIGPDTNGPAINFNAGVSTNWTLGTFTSITGFATNSFNLNFGITNNTGGFQNAYGGSFAISTNTNSLLLVYTAPVSNYSVTVDAGATNQGAALGGTNLFTGPGNSLTKLGAGTLIMTNPLNDYGGTTTISAGVISIVVNAPTNAAGALGNASTPVTVGSASTAVAAGFDLGAASVTNERSLNIIAGNGAGGTRSISTSFGSGAAVQAGGISFGTNASITAANGSTLLISGALSGSGGATINGPGAVVLSAANSGYSGTVTLSSGSTLRAGNNAALGTGGFTINGGTFASDGSTARTLANNLTIGGNATFGDVTGTGDLLFNGTVGLGTNARTLTVANNTTFAGAVSGSANLTKAGSGTATLSGTNTSFTGNVDITAGRLNVTNQNAIGNLAAVTISNGGTLGVNSLEEIGSLAGGGEVSLNGLLIAGGNGASTTYSGEMRNGGGFVKKGSGTLTLSGASVATGQTYIVGGTLLFTVNQATNFNNIINIGEEDSTGLASTLAFGGSGLTFTNNINVRAGDADSATIDAQNTAGTTTLNGTLTLGKNAEIRAASGGGLAINGVVSGANNLTKAGAGTATLSANNTLTGNVGVGAGTLALSGSGSLAAATRVNVAANSIFDISGVSGAGSTVKILSENGSGDGGSARLGGKVLTVTGGAANTTNFFNFLGLSGDTGGLTFNATNATYKLTLYGASAYTGTTTVGAGTLETLAAMQSGAFVLNGGTFATTSANQLSDTATMTFNGGAFTLGGTETIGGVTMNSNATVTVGSGVNFTVGAMSGSGALTKASSGTITFGAAASGYTGETIVNNGTVRVGANNALGTGTVTINFDSGTGTRELAATGATGYTLDNNFNLYYNAFTLGQSTGGTGSLVLGSAGKTFFLGNDGGVNTRVVTVNGSHTIAAQVTGDNSLSVTGGGSLTLSGNNTFSGGAQVSSGTILVGNNAALGTGTFTFNFADAVGSRVLASSSTNAYTLNNDFNVFDNVITIGQTSGGTGALTLGGAGKNFNLGSDSETKNRLITVNGNHTIAGNLTGGTNNNFIKLGDGTVTIGGTNNSFGGGLYIDSGVVNLAGAPLSGGNVLDIGGGAPGNAVNASSATLRISATNSYGRNIVINAETNSAGVAGDRAIEFAQASGSASLTGGISAEKTFTANVANASARGTLSGVISGAGGLTKTGLGTLTLSGASGNSITNLTTVSAGTLELSKSSGNAIGGNLVVSSGATLLLSASDNIANTSAVTLSGGTITRGAGVNEAFASLNLTTGSFLDFGTGSTGSMTFGTYEENATPSALLTINNFLPGNSFTFSNAQFAANGSNIGSYFTFGTGFEGRQITDLGGGSFTITAIPEPSTYLAAAGLLALFLWPVRRRLIKDAKSILGLRAPARDRLEAYRNA